MSAFKSNDRGYSSRLRVRGESSAGMLLGLVVVVCVIAVVAYFLLETPEVETPVLERTDQTSEVEIFKPPAPLPPPSDRIVEEYQLAGDLPLLGDSDSYLRGHLMFLAGEPLLSILQGDQLVRKIVTQVDSIAKGSIAHQHSPLLLPENKTLTVLETEEGAAYIDPSSYSRYDQYAHILGNIDSELLIAFYGFYEPLFEKANMELGHPEGSFRGTFIAALEEILKAPIVTGEIELHRPNVYWEFVDPELEAMDTVQKQLIRMGPENTEKVQNALRPLHDALVERESASE